MRLADSVLRARIFSSSSATVAVSCCQRSSIFHSPAAAFTDSTPSMLSISRPFFWFDSSTWALVRRASERRSTSAPSAATGRKTSGTSASGPAMKPMKATNNSAKGRSAATKRVEEVRKLRTVSNCRICAAKVPTVPGRASMRMARALPKK